MLFITNNDIEMVKKTLQEAVDSGNVIHMGLLFIFTTLTTEINRSLSEMSRNGRILSQPLFHARDSTINMSQ